MAKLPASILGIAIQVLMAWCPCAQKREAKAALEAAGKLWEDLHGSQARLRRKDDEVYQVGPMPPRRPKPHLNFLPSFLRGSWTMMVFGGHAQEL